MNWLKWFKKSTTVPKTGYVERAGCGHYVFAGSRTTTYLTIHQTINHTEDGATIGKREIPITFCSKCAKDIK